jgi:DNA-binding transcriptional ArsR family regulator
MPFFVEEDGKNRKAYDSLLVKDPKMLSALSSELALSIVHLLSKQPACAMDVARKLKQHEQKIYYHLRNLERIGVVKLLRKEERVGATAKIYAVDSPVVSFKLFDGKGILDAKTNVKEIKFFEPFIKSGRLNSKIVIGSPDPHGKYASQSSDGCCAIDMALFIGTLAKHPVTPNYMLDTEVKQSDLRENLILVGGPKANIIVEKVNRNLPIYFDFHREWDIVSPFSKNVYTSDNIGIVSKITNPFDDSRQVLVLAGRRFNGTRAAIIALIKYMNEVEKGNRFNPDVIAKVVQGIDKDSDGRVDDVEFLE